MRWTKIKDIIILLLLAVNVFLLALVGLRTYRGAQNQRESRRQMIAVLERNELAYLPDEVPGDLELPTLRLAVTPPGQAEAELLVGAITATSSQGARVTYTGALGSVSCSPTGEMDAAFLPGAAAVPDDIPALLSSLGIQVGERTEERADGAQVLHYVQQWNGAPIPGLAASVWLREGCLERITLRRLVGVVDTLGDTQTITASTALVRFLDELNRGEGYVCSQVTRLYPGYTLSGAGTVTLTPAWFVDTDTWHFAVDGHTGAVTAAE